MRRSLVLMAIAAARSPSTRAACEITDVEPTGVIPTTPPSAFSFVATNDCTNLVFVSKGRSKTPRPGMMIGADRRRYSASLTDFQWNLVANSGTDDSGFGDSVALVPDWTGNDSAELLVGAPNQRDDSGEIVGAVNVFFSDSLFP